MNCSLRSVVNQVCSPTHRFMLQLEFILEGYQSEEFPEGQENIRLLWRHVDDI